MSPGKRPNHESAPEQISKPITTRPAPATTIRNRMLRFISIVAEVGWLSGEPADWPIGSYDVLQSRIRNQHVLLTGGVSGDLVRIEGDPKPLARDRPRLVVVSARRRAFLKLILHQHVVFLALLFEIL